MHPAGPLPPGSLMWHTCWCCTWPRFGTFLKAKPVLTLSAGCRGPSAALLTRWRKCCSDLLPGLQRRARSDDLVLGRAHVEESGNVILTCFACDDACCVCCHRLMLAAVLCTCSVMGGTEATRGHLVVAVDCRASWLLGNQCFWELRACLFARYLCEFGNVFLGAG